MAEIKEKIPLTPEQKKAKIKEICRKLLFTPHSFNCVPSRCNCYLADIKQLVEILK